MASIYQAQLPGMPLEKREKRGSSGDVYHSYMARGCQFDQATGMPIMKPEHQIPQGLIPFSKAIGEPVASSEEYVHFYENDDQIERFWRTPWRYVDKLSRYGGLIATDYSTSPDLPEPVRIYNVYRNQLTGAWFQSLGFHALCNVRCPAFGCDYFLSGVPRGSILAVGSLGCVQSPADRARFTGGVLRILDELDPEGLVVLGEDSYDIYDWVRERGVRVYFFSSETQRYYSGVRDV